MYKHFENMFIIKNQRVFIYRLESTAAILLVPRQETTTLSPPSQVPTCSSFNMKKTSRLTLKNEEVGIKKSKVKNHMSLLLNDEAKR